VHDYNPNKDEKNAIAFLARLNPCTNGQDCDVDNCIYGHHVSVTYLFVFVIVAFLTRFSARALLTAFVPTRFANFAPRSIPLEQNLGI
jgi:hypothetical protein